MRRTHTCGELGKKDLGKEVTLAGWVNTRRDHGGVIFIDLRDRYGLTQIVFNPDQKEFSIAEHLRREDVIQVKGKIRSRPEGMTNPNLATGEIEVLVSELNLLNKAETPPIEVDDRIIASEEVRLKYRYLDLRRPIMQKHLIVRHKAAQAAREYLNSLGFLEIETPMLMKHTPEGARDYVVPSRVHPGKFYSLPQSPQLYKQILMVAGLDRYYQIARCLRDEDLRADRQPEFTQIDIEMSFVEENDIYEMCEGLMKAIVKKAIDEDIKIPFPRITYDDAMARFGVDKPDLRFGMELINVTDIASKSDFNVFKNSEMIKVIVSEKDMTRKDIDSMIDFAIKEGAKGLAWMRMGDSELESNIAKFFPADTQKHLVEKTKITKGQIMFFAADKEKDVNVLLGKVRLELARRFELMNPKVFKFCWIVDFPLFEWDDETEKWAAAHHIFTMPKEEHLDYIPEFPGKVRASCYDLVLNGVEMASGSIRIHRADIQEKVMNVIGFSHEEVEKKFGFLLEAFKYGAPPHGGIAPGFDRLVAMLLGYSDIREVIAFPKTRAAEGLMDGCPSELGEQQYKELHLKTTAKKHEKTRVFDEIEKFLSNNDIRFQVIEHAAVYTCEEAAKARGTKLEQAAKALVFKADSKPILAVLQGSRELDEEKLKALLHAKGLKMARADEVKQIMDCDIGSVHPFGNLSNLKVYADEEMLKEDEIVFNAGSHTVSIKMKSSDYKRVVEPIVGKFAK